MLKSRIPIITVALAMIIGQSANISKCYGNERDVVRSVREKPSFINRLRASISGFVTPQMFGAKGEGILDETVPIQYAINYAYENKIGEVRIPSGTYRINVSGKDEVGQPLIISGESHYFDLIGAGLILKSGVNIRLEEKTVLKALPSDLPEYAVVYIGEQRNIKVSGGKIVGDYAEHLGTEGQQGMCVWIQSSSNIIIEGCDISQGWGDCIDIGCKWNSKIKPGSNRSNDIAILNCTLHDSRRQGISVVGCTKLNVRNCRIYNISGDAPQAGVDLEVNFADYPNIDCTIDNVEITNCKGGGIIGYTTPTHGLCINNAVIQSVQLTCVDDVNIKNSTIGYVTLDNCFDAPADTVRINNTEIKSLTLYSGGHYELFVENCIMGKEPTQPVVAFVNRRNGNNISDAVNIHFKSCNLEAGEKMNLFSISPTVFPNTLSLENCNCKFYKPTSLFANKVNINECHLSGRSLTIDFYSPEVFMQNNTIETDQCVENINGYIYKFNSKKNVLFSGNKMIGAKKEVQYIVIPDEFTPECEIVGNDSRQYKKMATYNNKVRARISGNKLN